MSIVIYLGVWFVTNPSVRHFVAEFARGGFLGTIWLFERALKNADEGLKDEKDHGSDNKKVDRGQNSV